MDFGLRLKHLRVSKSITQRVFASRIGVSDITVRNWECNKKKPSMDALIRIATVLNMSLDDLLEMPKFEKERETLILSPLERALIQQYRQLDRYGQKVVTAVCELELERPESARSDSPAPNGYKLRRTPDSERFIPRYTTPAAAGTSVPLDGVDFEMMLVDESVPVRADFAVDIQGDSMWPYINDGDMVYVQKDAELQIGDVGIWCVDGAMYCKQYYLDNNRNLYLVSANESLRFTNVYVSADSGSNVKFCGKVLLGRRIDLPKYLFEDKL